MTAEFVAMGLFGFVINWWLSGLSSVSLLLAFCIQTTYCYSVNGFVGLDCIESLFVLPKSIIPNMLKSNYTPQTLRVYQPKPVSLIYAPNTIPHIPHFIAVITLYCNTNTCAFQTFLIDLIALKTVLKGFFSRRILKKRTDAFHVEFRGNNLRANGITSTLRCYRGAKRL